MTVALIVNAAEGKETGRSEKPRCFKGIDRSHLSVRYFNQKKAWMSGEILDKELTATNHKLYSKNRSVLRLMDNAGCHPKGFMEKYHQDCLPSPKYNLKNCSH